MRRETLWTPRLRLEPWGEQHTEMFVALARMPEVIRYVGDGKPWSQTRATGVSAASLEHWRRHGFGWRTVFDRFSDEAVGLAALNFAGDGRRGRRRRVRDRLVASPVSLGPGVCP